MYDFEFTVFTLELMAKEMENMPPDRFSKGFIVAFVQEIAKAFAKDGYRATTEEAYQKQLRLCREHGMLCLESYRRHKTGKSLTAVDPDAWDV